MWLYQIRSFVDDMQHRVGQLHDKASGEVTHIVCRTGQFPKNGRRQMRLHRLDINASCHGCMGRVVRIQLSGV